MSIEPATPCAPDSPLPTRHSNPFATCWTRPGALPFLPTAHASVEECIDRLVRAAWRGQILGPHGVGKSTLLAAIERNARQRGLVCRRLSGRARPSSASIDSPEGAHDAIRCVVLFDGFECLSSLRRHQWRRAARRRGFGLVVTSHAHAGLPTIATLRPRLSDVLAAYEALTATRPTPVGRECVEAAFARCGGNVREVWFDLYDLHERLSR